MKVEYKLGDTKPSLTAQLLAEVGYTLAGKTVSFKLRKPSAAVVTKSVTVEDPTTRQVRVDWTGTDLDEVGTYRGEFIVTDGGAERTFPNNRYITIVVNPDA